MRERYERGGSDGKHPATCLSKLQPVTPVERIHAWNLYLVFWHSFASRLLSRPPSQQNQASPSGSGWSSAAAAGGALSAAAFTRPTHNVAPIVTATATQPTVP